MNLSQLADRYWEAVAEYSPTIATVRGVHTQDDKLRRFDEPWLDEMADRFEGIAGAAANLDQTLSVQDRITQALLVQEATVLAKEIEGRFFVAAIDPYLGPHTRLLSDTRQNTVASAEQANALLERYRRVPEYLTGAMSLHRANASRGMTPAAASVTRVLSQLDGYLASSLEDDPFLALDDPRDDDWRAKATDIVRDVVRPALEQYAAEMRTEILPLSRPDERCGLTWIEGGDELYAHLIQKYTQTEMPAQEIHHIGQEWATEINAREWSEIGRSALGLESMEAIFERLHTDESLRFETEDEMLEHARSALDRAWRAVDDWFGTRPETACQVVPVPAATAPAMPPAYYMQPPVDGSRPGTYFLNTFKPEERDRFEYESIHFHEGIPGHHFDRSLASELEGIPTFRRYAQVYAHTEGWGLYSERLADEMGLYGSDLDRLGMVSADAWRAGRLVTDTGIHALGWSRQQAIDFLREWTPIGLLTVEQEVDRYVGMPGQALSYKIGQLEIMRLRDEARRKLGDAFDIKGFHDTMLVNGAMPLPMLTTAVDEWMESIS